MGYAALINPKRSDPNLPHLNLASITTKPRELLLSGLSFYLEVTSMCTSCVKLRNKKHRYKVPKKEPKKGIRGLQSDMLSFSYSLFPFTYLEHFDCRAIHANLLLFLSLSCAWSIHSQ